MKLDNDQIEKYLDGMSKEARAIREEALRFTWWMRGGLSYEEAMMLSPTDKEIIGSIIKDNIDTTKKTGVQLI